jgi:OmpA-OmpF porin, OOP family
MTNKVAALVALALLAACSKHDDEAANNLTATEVPAATPTPTDTPSATPTPAAAAGGFDPAAAPLATGTLPDNWPYFGLLDGYVAAKPEDLGGNTSRDWLENAKYERIDFFDGTKLIPVEGRAVVRRALGTQASWFEIKKNYEKLVHDLGGVTVWEGSGEVMTDKKLKFENGRYRGQWMLGSDEMGTYMARFADKQLWVEVYKPWDDTKGYWLTVLETRPLEVTVKAVPAEQLKQALDTQGHVALYINFDTDKTAMRPDAQPIVAEVVKLLQSNPGLKLEVQGHTDNAGTPAHNQQLSDGRASAVVDALMAQGIGLDRLTPKGYGQSKPIADNGSEDGRAKNRRVELVKRS